MSEINLGVQIRTLRKKKGLTQEALATALSVTPQAVSKWESGISYPEIGMIPLIAAYFGISLDTLFDYDIRKLEFGIQQILNDAKPVFYSDPDKYQSTIRAALKVNPGNETLLCALLDSYEHSLVCCDRTDLFDEMIDIAYQIIGTSQDFVKVCDVKENLAAAYLKMNRYDKAKEILESLPTKVTLRYDAMLYRLRGNDQIDAAEKACHYHLQQLYISCFYKGYALFESGKYQSALNAYQQGLTTLTTFINEEKTAEQVYLWEGMQTFHWGFLMRIGACYKRLGRVDECAAQVKMAYHIVETTWSGFAENKDYYMEPFVQELIACGLEEYIE